MEALNNHVVAEQRDKSEASNVHELAAHAQLTCIFCLNTALEPTWT